MRNKLEITIDQLQTELKWTQLSQIVQAILKRKLFIDLLEVEEDSFKVRKDKWASQIKKLQENNQM